MTIIPLLISIFLFIGGGKPGNLLLVHWQPGDLKVLFYC